MGILRKIAKFFLSFIFSILLSCSVLIFLAHRVTDYQTGKMIFNFAFTKVVGAKVSQEELEKIHGFVQLYCQINESVSIPVAEENITLKCEDALKASSSGLLNLISSHLFDSLYYKQYGCEFLQCLREIKSPEDFTVILSSKAHEFFDKILLPSVLFTALTGFFLLISCESWDERFQTFGLNFLLVGIFFLIFPFFKEMLLSKIPPEAALLEEIFNMIFELISPILLAFLILGIAMLLLWIFTKFKKRKTK